MFLPTTQVDRIVSVAVPGEARHGQRCPLIKGTSGLMRCSRDPSS